MESGASKRRSSSSLLKRGWVRTLTKTYRSPGSPPGSGDASPCPPSRRCWPESTPALGAGGGGHHLAEGGLLDPGHLAGAPALIAGHRRGSRLRPRPAARRAGLHPRDLDGGLKAGGHLLQGHIQVVAEVATPSRPPAATPASAAEEYVEDGPAAASGEAEAPEEVLEVDAPEEVLLGVAAVYPGVAELVVLLPLVGVGEDGVGLGDLLEPLLGVGLLGLIGMVLEGELPVSAFDLFRVGFLFDPENLVVVSLAPCHRLSSPHLQRSHPAFRRPLFTDTASSTGPRRRSFTDFISSR